MQSFSESVCLFEASVHPHKSRAALAPSPDLDEHQIPRFPSTTHLVAVPHHDRFPRVCWVDDLQPPYAFMWNTASQQENVDADHVTP